MTGAPDPKDRFTDRVDDYARWRPAYPAAVTEALAEVAGLTADWVVADLGAGTGLSSRPFLEHGCTVLAVEPNDAMRGAAERDLGRHPRFTALAGSAEATGLPDRSVDLVIAAQAFHWFDPAATRLECRRILGEPGWGAVLWNVRRTDHDRFARGYEDLLQRWGTDYARYRARRIDAEDLRSFFGAPPLERLLDNGQTFDLEGLRGRHLSSSYVPSPHHPDHEPMMRDLVRLFERCAEEGVVRFRYDTQLFVARVT